MTAEDYAPDTALRCEKCRKRLSSGYFTHRVNASEARLEIAPDGSGLATTVKAVTTCSWHCLAAVIGKWDEPPIEGEPF